MSWNKSVQNCSDGMRAWLCPCGKSDFTLHSRAALTVHMVQSYSVLALVSQFFRSVHGWNVCSGSVPQRL